ncbi:MAG TPA: murein biosynthesis integral membrane protein MurJ [Gemmatimonadales bacterium]|nr:murein biosynthesis integral membrane protein MurJ [Gemmatimonadales bacterium]
MLRRSAALVAAGIFLSRILGLVRQRAFAHFLGNTAVADAFTAAFRIPNLLQNLFGEGALSASFIPVYAKLLAEEDHREADRVAGAVGALLGLAVATIVILGVLASPVLVTLIAPGFGGGKRELTIHLVRILFPGAGLLVLSAWCLGVLNSHRRFFLSYAAPVVWNLSMIGALIYFGPRREMAELAVVAAWASVVGSLLQVAVQWPTVRRVAPAIRFRLETTARHVGTVLRNFVPAFVGRGVVQVSAFIDSLLATLLPTGAVAAIGYAQTLYLLPVSLFGMAISAAELPAMSGARGTDAEIGAFLRTRLQGGLRHVAFLVVPSAMAFLALGHVLVSALYQTGEFGRRDSLYVWGILAGSAVGLLASTMGRLYASAFYALHDTRTPLRFAVIRVALTGALGWFAALHLPGLLVIGPEWGAAGLTASAGVAGWLEFVLLRRSLGARIGSSSLPPGLLPRLWCSAALAAALGWLLLSAIPAWHPVPTAAAVLSLYGTAYFLATRLLGVQEARTLLGRR